MDAKTYPRRLACRGFTLVELLVVIIIISMLAGLALTGGAAALRAAKRATIIIEIQQLTIALEQYKNEYGEYPPDCFSVDLETDTITQSRVLRHFRKRFPRYRPGAYGVKLGSAYSNLGSTPAEINWNSLRLDIYNASCAAANRKTDPDTLKNTTALEQGLDINTLTPSNALFFFLGGIPDYTAGGELLGFSANPNIPVDRNGSRAPSSFEFDETRIQSLPSGCSTAIYQDASVYKYVPKHIKNPGNSSLGVPYVYFKPQARAYGPRTLEQLHSDTAANRVAIPSYPFLTPDTDIGICLPYAQMAVTASSPKDGTPVDWHADKQYQIIAAGLDGMYGTTDATNYDLVSRPLDAYRYLNADANNLRPEEDDNLSSFTPGRLEDGLQ